jgi:hypothetical protein
MTSSAVLFVASSSEVNMCSGAMADAPIEHLSGQQAEFLSNASERLAESLDYDVTLQTVARVALPYLADWCVVDILDQDAAIQRAAVAHVDPAQETAA